MTADNEGESLVFIDTNVWLYAFIQTQDKQKNIIANNILSSINPVVSAQVINEICVNLLKKASISEPDLKALVQSFYFKYQVVMVDQETLLCASDLRLRFSLSYWDSIIVSSALQAGCTRLYTEDMQHELIVNNTLTVYNPFI